ncbi:MAG TPA: XRE family transcriptional regulator [Candidatus Baltobacteraceae bacterium]|nr:XRE family transcriptional regulator [Candidatus Baltobacteraceae bacterium]
MPRRPAKHIPTTKSAPAPDVGTILKRLRDRNGVSVRDLAKASGLSASFIRAVERGDSDISLGRLARLAQFFEYDLGSFLGYSAQLSRPNFVMPETRKKVNRGRGVDYEALHLPGIDLDFIMVKCAPHSRFKNELAHEGIDIVYVIDGNIVLVVDGVDYPMSTGDCCAFSAAYPHLVRNDSARRATFVSLTTGRMY